MNDSALNGIPKTPTCPFIIVNVTPSYFVRAFIPEWLRVGGSAFSSTAGGSRILRVTFAVSSCETSWRPGGRGDWPFGGAHR